MSVSLSHFLPFRCLCAKGKFCVNIKLTSFSINSEICVCVFFNRWLSISAKVPNAHYKQTRKMCIGYEDAHTYSFCLFAYTFHRLLLCRILLRITHYRSAKCAVYASIYSDYFALICSYTRYVYSFFFRVFCVQYSWITLPIFVGFNCLLLFKTN